MHQRVTQLHINRPTTLTLEGIAECLQQGLVLLETITFSVVLLQFVNKDIVPIDGPATVKAAYKLWKQSGRQTPPAVAGAKWTRLSKAEMVPSKNPDSLTVHAQAPGEEVQGATSGL